jgi:hypothetical protein
MKYPVVNEGGAWTFLDVNWHLIDRAFDVRKFNTKSTQHALCMVKL